MKEWKSFSKEEFREMWIQFSKSRIDKIQKKIDRLMAMREEAEKNYEEALDLIDKIPVK